MHFDKVYYYGKHDLKLKKYADNKQYKEYYDLFADLTDIMDASKPFPKYITISQRIFDTYPYFDKSHGLLSFLDISNSVKVEDHYENSNITPEDQLKRKTEEWSCLQLNRQNKNSNIQSSDASLKRFY